uniref:EGF-like domain-containing protein n=1 Tax=Parascaris equorum TaxID=6256 RepID=A0A914RTI2_PAREQ
MTHIFGLAVFEDFLYWTDWTNRTVERAHKITGEMRTVILNFTHYRPMGVKASRSERIVHPLLQMTADGQHLSHPCRKANRCDNICLASKSQEEFTCVCAQGFRAEGNKCKPDCKPSDFICHNTFKCLPFWWVCDGQDDCGDMEDERFGIKASSFNVKLYAMQSSQKRKPPSEKRGSVNEAKSGMVKGRRQQLEGVSIRCEQCNLQ